MLWLFCAMLQFFTAKNFPLIWFLSICVGKILQSSSCVSFTLIRLPHLHLWHQTCWGFSYIFHRQVWDQLTSYNLTQFDTANLINDSVPWDSPGFRCQSQVADYPQLLSNLATGQTVPWPAPWILLFAGTVHRTQGNIYLLYQSIKRCDKEYRWTEIHWVKSGRVLSTAASDSMELGDVSPSWYMDVFTNLEDLWNQYFK